MRDDSPNETRSSATRSSATRSDAPLLALTLWPHRSLPRKSYPGLLMLVAAGFALPVGAVIQFKGGWVIAAFAAGATGLLHYFMRATYRTGRVRETLELWPDLLRVARDDPGGRRRVWEANPHWVRVSLHDTPSVRSYLVLSASGEEVELGAFLTAEERRALAAQIRQGLVDASGAPRA